MVEPVKAVNSIKQFSEEKLKFIIRVNDAYQRLLQHPDFKLLLYDFFNTEELVYNISSKEDLIANQDFLFARVITKSYLLELEQLSKFALDEISYKGYKHGKEV